MGVGGGGTKYPKQYSCQGNVNKKIRAARKFPTPPPSITFLSIWLCAYCQKMSENAPDSHIFRIFSAQWKCTTRLFSYRALFFVFVVVVVVVVVVGFLFFVFLLGTKYLFLIFQHHSHGWFFSNRHNFSLFSDSNKIYCWLDSNRANKQLKFRHYFVNWACVDKGLNLYLHQREVG